LNLAVFLSGRGSNFEAILEAIDKGTLAASVCLVVTHNPSALGARTALSRGIPVVLLQRESFPDGGSFATAMIAALQRHSVDWIVLAGYMKMVPPAVVKAFPGQIVNIHPALLPKFGGKGMFGHHVHQAVLDAGETVTGVTIHFVDEIYDHGLVIAQETVPVLPGDTAATLGARVLEMEHLIYPRILAKIAGEYHSRQ